MAAPTHPQPYLKASGLQCKTGKSTVTGTLAIETGFTTVVSAHATLNDDAGIDPGDAAFVTAAISGGTVTLKAWQDSVVAATNAAVISWEVYGR